MKTSGRRALFSLPSSGGKRKKLTTPGYPHQRLILMANKVSINLSTHNIHGFHGSKDYLNARCGRISDSIICVQEHWLRPAYKNLKSVNQIRVVHPEFDGYAVSAMKGSHTKNISCGRPYGGTGLIFNKQFTPFLRPLIKYESERITVMELLDMDGPILIINSYFLFRQNTDEHKVEYLEVLGCIKEIITSNPMHKLIVLGDFNYDLYDPRSEIAAVLRDFLREYDLFCSHDMDTTFNHGSSFTRSCIKSGSYSLLDYIFISRSLRERVRTVQYYMMARIPRTTTLCRLI